MQAHLTLRRAGTRGPGMPLAAAAPLARIAPARLLRPGGGGRSSDGADVAGRFSILRSGLAWLMDAVGALVGRPCRLLAGAASAAVSLGAAGGLALLTLAQPAFRDTGPGWLKRLDLSVTFLDRNGREIGHRGIRHDDRVALSDMAPHLVQAVIATEDRRFFKHWGIDPWGLGRALVANAEADGVVQGGSTVTQQLAKGLFLSGERTLERKIREAFLAVWLEAHLSKPEILKLYLDRAYLGPEPSAWRRRRSSISANPCGR